MDIKERFPQYIKKPLYIWLVWFSVHLLASVAISLLPIPLRLGYRFTDVGIGFGVPEWIGMHANFDGVHYMTIAREGYGLLQQAFFPLYPLVLRMYSPVLFENTLVAGWVISSVASLVGVVVWGDVYRRLTKDVNEATSALLALLLFPTAFFLVTVYNESIFMLLLGIFVWSLLAHKRVLCGLVGVLLGLTRLAGVWAIFIPATMIIYKYAHQKTIDIRVFIAGLTPLIGLGLFMTYSYLNFGDALAFFHIQEQFNNNRSTSFVMLPQVLWRYLNIFTKARVDVVYFVAVIEFIVFISVLCLLLWGILREIKRVRKPHKAQEHAIVPLGLLIFSVVNLIVPTFTGTLSSTPRYALVGMGLYMLIASLPRSIRTIVLLVSFSLQMVLFALFARGWFVS